MCAWEPTERQRKARYARPSRNAVSVEICVFTRFCMQVPMLHCIQILYTFIFTFLWKNMKCACIARNFQFFSSSRAAVAAAQFDTRNVHCAIIYDRHHSCGRELSLPAAVAFMIIMCKHIKYGRKWRFASCEHDPPDPFAQ